MLFSSISFLYYFLPCVLVLYVLVPRHFKNIILLISSLIFYAWGEPRLVLLMSATIVIGYVLGILMERDSKRKKLYLLLALICFLGALGYFKYTDFFIDNINKATGLSIPLLQIGLPIGISFYTFQILSYNIDVYRGDVKAQKKLMHLATYITMFPQLIAGPIVRYKDVAVQLASREHSMDKVALGIRRFVFGLSKKILIANVLGELCETFRVSNDKSVLFYWMYTIAFSLHIYFDFSGYSDMAIGLGKIFGFDFMENFNYPYISKSITEFWRRWHISLGNWFRDYVYIPLGGSRVNVVRHLFNILVVWMLTGFWHGAAWNFIIWGLYFAVLLVIEKTYLLKYLEHSKVLSHVYVVFAVVISFVVFNATSLPQVLTDIGGLFGSGNLPLVSAEALYYLRSYAVIFVLAIVGATPIPKKVVCKWKVLQYVEPIIILLLLVVITAYLVDGSFNPFLYFRF